MRIGCNIGGVFINVLAYADDLVLLAPSWNAMLQMLTVLHSEFSLRHMSCNLQKTVCMVFSPKNRARIVSNAFPLLAIGQSCINYVSKFKYLGHTINNGLTDDDDIGREIRSMFARTNILMCRFGKYSLSVKL